MSPNPVAVFPIEVFEEIIDQANDNDASLHNLSLSCRNFLPRARFNLFFHIHIGHREKLESGPAFLRGRPWLPPLVRRLTIRDYVKRDPFMLLTVVPARLLAMLPNLRSLEFATDGRSGGQAPVWSRYALAYKHPVPSLLHKPCARIRHLELTQLRFRTAVDFVQLLCALPSLKSLVCGGTFYVPFPAAEQSRNDWSSVIKEKTIGLTHLVTDGDLNTEALNHLLEMSWATLEDLTMSTVQYSWEEAGAGGYSQTTKPLAATTLSRLSQLRTLTLTIPNMERQESKFTPVEFATKILSSLPTSAALKYLAVVWSPVILTSLAFKVGDASEGPLLKVEQAITRLSFHEVVFSTACCRKNRRILAASGLDRAFPALKERGILRVTDTPLHPNQRTWLSDTVMGHEAYVSSLVASPDGKLFASSSFDGTVILWDAHQGTIVHEWAAHSGRRVRCLAFSPDGRRLFSDGTDRIVKFWDLSDNVRQVYALEFEADGGTTLSDGPDASADLDAPRGCAWSPDGMWIASTTASRKPTGMVVHLWQQDARDGGFRRRRSFDGLATPSRFRGPAACFSPDSRRLVWAAEFSGSYHICVWDALEPDASPRTFAAHPDDGTSLPDTFSFDLAGKRLLAAHGLRLRVWDMETGGPLTVMEGHAGYITSGCFSSDGRTVLSASEDGTAKVWDVGSGGCVLSIESHARDVVQALYSSDGQCIATASKERTMRLWKARDGSCLANCADHRSPLSHIVFSPGGETLAVGDAEGIVYTYDVSRIIGH